MAHKTPSYATKMLLKVVFEKTAFVKFKLVITLNKKLIKYIHNNQKSTGNPYQSMDFKNLKKKNKIR